MSQFDNQAIPPKCWVISFPRCGTASTCTALGQLGYDVIHNPYCWQDLDGFTAAGDFFVAANWRELYALFPDSKFIMLTREPDEWRQSIETIRGVWDSGLLFDVFHRRKLFKCDLLKDIDQWNLFSERRKEVQKVIPQNQLLVCPLSTIDWEVLCGFLGKPIPEGVRKSDFPRKNKGVAGEGTFRIVGGMKVAHKPVW